MVTFDPSSSAVCFGCARRRCERKEIITEIVDTEVKYGRDLAIIRDEFQRPMRVAGLLTSEQLQVCVRSRHRHLIDRSGEF